MASANISISFPAGEDTHSTRARQEFIWNEVLKSAAQQGSSSRNKDTTDPPTVNGRRRIVLRQWPRDPEGPVMKESPPGKQAGNGLPLWGATLMDFFHVHRMPKVPMAVTISTGSKLAAYCKSIGELEAAAEEIYWTEQEEDPVELHPYDVAVLIKTIEDRAHMGFGFGKSARPSWEQNTRETKPESSENHTCMFDKSLYPSPWPLVPFSSFAPELQKRIPFHLLPQVLVVHDPDHTLRVDAYHFDEEEEAEGNDDEGADNENPDDEKLKETAGAADDDNPKPTQCTPKQPIDKIYTYKLQLSPEAQVTADSDRARAAEDAAVNEGFILMPTMTESGDVPQAVRVKFPPRPRIEAVPEAHLYLSKDRMLGRGDHSYVYMAEWEVPRALLVPPEMCQHCVLLDVDKQLREQEAQVPGVQAGVEHVETPGVADKMGRVTIMDHRHPGEDLSIISAEGLEARRKARAKASTAPDASTPDSAPLASDNTERMPLRDEQTYRTEKYDGPIRELTTRVQWQSDDQPSTFCRHHTRDLVPPTATVRLAAKLSIQDDDQLGREAENYQKFPVHMFQRWSGYNVIPPLHDPVPVGAVVPQFYGYYIPGEPAENETSHEQPRYLSPIMLLEDCGKPIDPRKLNIDDRHECASLLYRLHSAGFIHNSVFERNIVMQLIALQDHPLAKWEKDRRFRLIDFGRTVKADPSERVREEVAVAGLLKILYLGDV